MSKESNKHVIVKEEWCKGCGICVEFCPRKVLVLQEDKVKIRNPEVCIQCGLCELRCPDYAIYLGGDENEK